MLVSEIRGIVFLVIVIITVILALYCLFKMKHLEEDF